MISLQSRLNVESKLPWYLSSPEGDTLDEPTFPDFVVCTSPDAIAACLTTTQTSKNTFSGKCISRCTILMYTLILTLGDATVYAGFPNIPFINFGQVVLPKYEANTKMGELLFWAYNSQPWLTWVTKIENKSKVRALCDAKESVADAGEFIWWERDREHLDRHGSLQVLTSGAAGGYHSSCVTQFVLAWKHTERVASDWRHDYCGSRRTLALLQMVQRGCQVISG